MALCYANYNLYPLEKKNRKIWNFLFRMQGQAKKKKQPILKRFILDARNKTN